MYKKYSLVSLSAVLVSFPAQAESNKSRYSHQELRFDLKEKAAIIFTSHEGDAQGAHQAPPPVMMYTAPVSPVLNSNAVPPTQPPQLSSLSHYYSWGNWPTPPSLTEHRSTIGKWLGITAGSTYVLWYIRLLLQKQYLRNTERIFRKMAASGYGALTSDQALQELQSLIITRYGKNESLVTFEMAARFLFDLQAEDATILSWLKYHKVASFVHEIMGWIPLLKYLIIYGMPADPFLTQDVEQGHNVLTGARKLLYRLIATLYKHQVIENAA